MLLDFNLANVGMCFLKCLSDAFLSNVQKKHKIFALITIVKAPFFEE